MLATQVDKAKSTPLTEARSYGLGLSITKENQGEEQHKVAYNDKEGKKRHIVLTYSP